MPLIAPLFVDDGYFSSTLVLVNGSAVPTYADVTVRGQDGRIAATKRVNVLPHDQQQISIRSLLDSQKSSMETTGSITVMQNADVSGMVISAALSITRLSSSVPNYIDEELAMPSATGSSTLYAVADKGEGLPLVALSSISATAQHIQVRCLGKSGVEFSKSVELAAGETILTAACSEETVHGANFQRYLETLTHEDHDAIGISLSSDGMPGSFSAFGLSPHGSEEKRYFSSVSFSDPKMIMSATTVFTGVPVGLSAHLPEGKYIPSIALANFSARNLLKYG